MTFFYKSPECYSYDTNFMIHRFHYKSFFDIVSWKINKITYFFTKDIAWLIIL